MQFDEAFELVIGHEGGFQKDPVDRGNWTGGTVGKGQLKGTKYGISAASYPHLDIENITLSYAKMFYKKIYWNESMPDSIKFQFFDASIHHGIAGAGKILQKALKVVQDGIVGAKTIAAMEQAGDKLPFLFLAERLDYMTDIRTWPHFSRGWAKRIAKNIKVACD